VHDLRPALEKLDDRGIEAHGNGARDLQHERGTRRRPAPRLARPVAVPRPMEPKVRPELEAAVELDQQVLARRVDGIDLLADDAADLRSRQPGAGSRDDPPGQVRPQGNGNSCERVAFRHQAIIAPARGLRRTSPR
jgi:hypothetical protein